MRSLFRKLLRSSLATRSKKELPLQMHKKWKGAPASNNADIGKGRIQYLATVLMNTESLAFIIIVHFRYYVGRGRFKGCTEHDYSI